MIYHMASTGRKRRPRRQSMNFRDNLLWYKSNESVEAKKKKKHHPNQTGTRNWWQGTSSYLVRVKIGQYFVVCVCMRERGDEDLAESRDRCSVETTKSTGGGYGCWLTKLGWPCYILILVLACFVNGYGGRYVTYKPIELVASVQNIESPWPVQKLTYTTLIT